jgi:hypothetical protein
MEPTSIAGPAGIAIGALLVAASWLGPGLALCTALGLGRDALERFVLAVALGRLALALAALAATAIGAPALLAIAPLGAAAGAFGLTRLRAPATPRAPLRPALPALGVAVACALLLAHAVVARSAVSRGGDLVFFGRDSAFDPLVYGSFARALAERGLPLANPFAGGNPATGSYVLFAVLAGLHGGGAPMPDLVYRVLPSFEAIALGASAIALCRALGAPRLAWSLAPLLLLLGGDPGPWLGALGLADPRFDSWALFGPYLLAFNPIAAGLQSLLCALLLLARADSASRREAWVAGLLLGAVVEVKLFLWAPALAGLLAVAFLCPPRGSARALRRAAALACAVSLPSLAEKAAFALRSPGEETGFAPCLLCLPRYLADAAWGSRDASFAIFRAGGELSAGALAEAVAVAAIALGARALALPELLRGARAGGGVVAVHRLLAFACAVGFALAFAVATPPHHLNAAQFAWIATFGLWIPAAIAAARWVEGGRWPLLLALALLALPGSLYATVRLGYRAPETLRVEGAEAALAAALREASAPADVLLEPSMLLDADRPSPFPLLAGRPVYLSLLSAVMGVPAAEREARFARVASVFAGDDAAAARRALHETGAAFLYAPRGAAPRALPADALELLRENAAGRLYRVSRAATPAAPSASVSP